MIDKTSAAGWIVQVTVPTPAAVPSPDALRWIGRELPSAPTFKYFNVAVEAAGAAVEATTKHLDETSHEVQAVRKLSPGEVAALSLKAGEVRPA